MNLFETLLRPDQEALLNWLFLILTGLTAWYGLGYRGVGYRGGGKTDLMRLMFGCVSVVFFFLVLFQDLLALL